MFLSIIIPVYNTEKYLEECLKSLLRQNLKPEEYEIICINDGSTDKSLVILNRYSQKYSNIKVINTENGGVSRARNLGLAHAIGEYVWFVDSDDFIAVNILAELKEAASSDGYDRVAFDLYMLKDYLNPTEQAAYEEGIFYGGSHYKDANACTSILRKAVIRDHQLMFRNSSYGEDSLFIFEFLFHARRQMVLDRTLYFYRVRSGSAMTEESEKTILNKIHSHINNAVILKEYYEGKKGPVQDREACANLLMSNLYNALLYISRMERRQAGTELKELEEAGLFPYKRLKECTLTKSYMTTRTDLYGRLFDYLFLHLNQRAGYAAMRILNKLRGLAKRDKKV